MKYIIMLSLVTFFAVMDIITGIIKAYNEGNVSSKSMRKGGLNKIAEVLVMGTVCGLDIGLNLLGTYYDIEQYTAFTGQVTAIAVFGYIALMEIISILENYCAVTTSAKWAVSILKRLKCYEGTDSTGGND